MIRSTAVTVVLAAATAGSILATPADAATSHAGGRLILGTHRVVQRSTLPHCDAEDFPTVLPCTWNVGSSVDGNGRGLAYWADSSNRVHYVWASDPRHGAWHWVGKGWASAMRSDKTLAPRRWKACIIRVADTTVIRCADGSRFTS